MKLKDYTYLIIPFLLRLVYASLFFAGNKGESTFDPTSIFGFLVDVCWNYFTILLPYLIVTNGVTCNFDSNIKSNINDKNIINILTQTAITQLLINIMILVIKSNEYFGAAMTNFEDTNDFSNAILVWFGLYLIISITIIEINKKQSDVFCKKNIYEKINVGSLFIALCCVIVVAVLKFIPVYLTINNNECAADVRTIFSTV